MNERIFLTIQNCLKFVFRFVIPQGPCPTHGAGLAAKMAELPETLRKNTLSTHIIKRNKRTQTPSKTSQFSEGSGVTDRP